MTIKSMTGHGCGKSSCSGGKIIIELHSVNHRQFDLRLDLPPRLLFMETEMRRMIHKSVARGSVVCRCHFIPGPGLASDTILIDQNLLEQCLRETSRAARALKVTNDLKLTSLLALPGALKILPVSAGARGIRKAAIKALRLAQHALCAMRGIEGRFLAGELGKRIARLNAIVSLIERRAPAAVNKHRRKLRKLLFAACREAAKDKKMLHDIVSAATRMDIAEEIERSRSHLRQMTTLLASNASVGRTLDFLLQELLREMNTLGAKADDLTISKLTVNYKTELECIREQVQNIE